MASMHLGSSKGTKKTPIASKEGSRTPRSAGSKPMVAQRQLSLKNVPPPKKPRSKSMSLCPTAVRPKTVSKQLNDSLTSDVETKTKKELEEMRIFEMMEEKAENSSFCSTSSTVMAFLQQSTPLKFKKANQMEGVNGDVKDNESKGAGKTVPLRRRTFGKNSQLPKWQSLVEQSQKQQNFQNKFVRSLDRRSLINVKVNDDKEDPNASLHVRFAEFNEYKTMTDTSSVSSVEPSIKGVREDERAWSDCSSESSDKENVDKQQSEESSFLTNPEESLSDTALLNEMMLEAKSQLATALNRKESNIKPYVDTPQRFDSKRLQLPSRVIKDKLIANCEDEMDFTTDSTDDADYTEEKETTIIDMDSDEPKDKPAESPVNGKLAASSVESINDNGTVFKSDLLKSRLLELEREIDIFRRENAALAVQRQSLEEEKKKMQKDFKVNNQNKQSNWK